VRAVPGHRVAGESLAVVRGHDPQRRAGATPLLQSRVEPLELAVGEADPAVVLVDAAHEALQARVLDALALRTVHAPVDVCASALGAKAMQGEETRAEVVRRVAAPARLGIVPVLVHPALPFVGIVEVHPEQEARPAPGVREPGERRVDDVRTAPGRGTTRAQDLDVSEGLRHSRQEGRVQEGRALGPGLRGDPRQVQGPRVETLPVPEHPVNRGDEAREHGRVAGRGVRDRGESAREAHAPRRQAVEEGRRPARVPVARDVVRAQRVDRDEHDALEARRTARAGSQSHRPGLRRSGFRIVRGPTTTRHQEQRGDERCVHAHHPSAEITIVPGPLTSTRRTWPPGKRTSSARSGFASGVASGIGPWAWERCPAWVEPTRAARTLPSA